MNRFTTIQFHVRLGLLAVVTLLATPVRSAPAGGLAVLVRTIDAEAISGRLVSFSLDRGLTLENHATEETLRIPSADVVRITTDAVPDDDRTNVPLFILSAGDRLIGRPVDFAEDMVTIETTSLGRVIVPMERISAYVTAIGRGTAWSERIEQLVNGPVAGSDVVLLANGDRAAGVVLAIDADHLVLETSAGASRLPLDRIAAVRIVAPPAPSRGGLSARLDFADGSRLRVAELSWKDAAASARVFADATVNIDAGQIVRAEIEGGRWTHLAEVTPISTEQIPMIALDWPVERDRNVLGGPLRVAGQQFERGLGVHSRSALTYDLGGEYRRFVTSYGLDDDSGPLADVRVSILVDGQVRHQRDGVRQGELIGPVTLDVGDARNLELIVDFGRLAAVQDRFNWLDPALIR
ncbi:MAG: hypothetical protein HOP29_19380 [Phycisphaerales bacterium]|nr:hypothetical protein [Phycisphaerales bacterium]